MVLDWMGRFTHMVDGGFYGYPHDSSAQGLGLVCSRQEEWEERPMRNRP